MIYSCRWAWPLSREFDQFVDATATVASQEAGVNLPSGVGVMGQDVLVFGDQHGVIKAGVGHNQPVKGAARPGKRQGPAHNCLEILITYVEAQAIG